MENATKALLIAGTVLISLLVITVGIFAFKQMSDYQKSKSDLIKEKQIAKFNEGFTQYISNETKGIDIITLVNKVIDFNSRKEEEGYGVIDYNNKITLEIDMTSYNAIGESVFKKQKYIIREKNNFTNIISNYIKLEEKYTIKTIQQLSSNIETLKSYYIYGDTLNGRNIEQVIGSKKYNNSQLEKDFKNRNFKELEQYSEYSEFKSSKFKGEEPEYKDGQIVKLKFKYIGK